MHYDRHTTHFMHLHTMATSTKASFNDGSRLSNEVEKLNTAVVIDRIRRVTCRLQQ